jgi:hypothetical protein
MNFLNTNRLLLLIIFFLFALLLLITGAYIQKVITRLKKRSLLHSNQKDGALGEVRAKQYLLKHGFAIIKEQAYSEHQIVVDGKPHSFQLRVDFIVSKNGVVSIVDAKSGEEGVDPTNSNTRRQLLEYFIYYKADNAYVYNSITDVLHEVEFVSANVRKKGFSIGYIALLLIIIELIGIVSLKMLDIRIPF